MIGARSLVCYFLAFYSLFSPSLLESTTEHRARTLSAILPTALATGYAEIDPDLEPLKVL
jgi:hypothetical protein